jgi:hypothetical protein
MPWTASDRNILCTRSLQRSHQVYSRPARCPIRGTVRRRLGHVGVRAQRPAPLFPRGPHAGRPGASATPRALDGRVAYEPRSQDHNLLAGRLVPRRVSRALMGGPGDSWSFPHWRRPSRPTGEQPFYAWHLLLVNARPRRIARSRPPSARKLRASSEVGRRSAIGRETGGWKRDRRRQKGAARTTGIETRDAQHRPARRAVAASSARAQETRGGWLSYDPCHPPERALLDPRDGSLNIWSVQPMLSSSAPARPLGPPIGPHHELFVCGFTSRRALLSSLN